MKRIIGWMLAVCMLAGYCPVVQAAGEEKEDVTLAPYFFIQEGDPSVDGLPLKGTSVRTNVNGVIAETYVTQTYANEGERPINATYVFPASTKGVACLFLSDRRTTTPASVGVSDSV